MLITPVKIDVGYKAPGEAKESSNPMQSCPSVLKSVLSIYAEALTFANDFRTSKRACFFNRMTLNRSKSVNARLRSFWTRFLAHALSCHFASISAFFHAAATTPVREARGRFSRTRGVRMSCARAIDWRGTAILVFVAGPSIKACIKSIFASLESLEFMDFHIRACGR